jgi:hypothetical protein
MEALRRSLAWLKEEPFGVEFVQVSLLAGRLAATGVAIGSEPAPYRLDYRLVTRRGFVTSRLRVASRGEGWRRELDLRRSPAGEWTAYAQADGQLDLRQPGGNLELLRDAPDCDLGLSPLTNTMPVLRNRLLEGGSAATRVAWVAVPGLSFEAVEQRYTYVRTEADNVSIIRFEDEHGFSAEISFDTDGLVVFYPELARRLEAGRP